MPTPTKYSIPLEQDTILSYIVNTIPNRFENRLVKTSNVSLAEIGICQGISNSFLMYENNNLGTHYIRAISDSFNSISSNELPKNTLEKYILNSKKKFDLTILETLFSSGINNQIDYEYALELNNLSKQVNRLEISDNLNKESNINYLKKLLKSINFEEILNNKFTFLKEKENNKHFDFFMKDLMNSKDSSLESINIPIKKIDQIKVKLRNEIPLTKNNAMYILKAYFHHESAKINAIISDRKIRAGLINDNTYTLGHKINTHDKHALKTHSEIKQDIEESLLNKGYYYSSVATKTHAMAISAKINGNEKIYKFFQPTYGLLETKDKHVFYNHLFSIIDDYNIKGKVLQTTAKQGLLDVSSIERKIDYKNTLKLPEFKDIDIQNHIKSELIRDNVKIDLNNEYKLKLKSHDPITNITKATIYGHYKKWNISSNESDIKKMVDSIAEKLPLIKNKKGSVYINNNGDIYSQKLKLSLKNVLKNTFKFS